MELSSIRERIASWPTSREVCESSSLALRPGSEIPCVEEDGIGIHLSLHLGEINLSKRGVVRRDHNCIHPLNRIEKGTCRGVLNTAHLDCPNKRIVHNHLDAESSEDPQQVHARTSARVLDSALVCETPERHLHSPR